MKYVALLRGINVGGNTLVKMSELKEVFEKIGFTDVRTYINSGNVLFESVEKNDKKLTDKLESLLTKTFNYNIRVVVKSHDQLKQIISNFPPEWNTQTDLRCYVGFLTEVIPAMEGAKEIKLKEGIDTLKIAGDVFYMTTLLSKKTKSSFNRLVGTKIYKEMTIRNYTTVKKLLVLMEV